MGVERLIWLHSGIIVSHSLYPRFGRSLSAISDRDYPNRIYITEPIEAIDLDSYEKSLPGGNNDCTVDAVVGICNERQGRTCNERHLLVELRMGYKNVDNLSSLQIKQKDDHSRVLLNGCPDGTPIDPSLCLLFDPSIVNQAENRVSRMRGEYTYARNWLVFSPTTFCNHVNAGREIPYTPKAKTIGICERFKAIGDAQDWATLDKESQAVFDYLSECETRYEKGECSYICQSIDDLLPQLKSWQFEDEDDRDYYETVIEDIERRLQNAINRLEN